MWVLKEYFVCFLVHTEPLVPVQNPLNINFVFPLYWFDVTISQIPSNFAQTVFPSGSSKVISSFNFSIDLINFLSLHTCFVAPESTTHSFSSFFSWLIESTNSSCELSDSSIISLIVFACFSFVFLLNSSKSLNCSYHLNWKQSFIMWLFFLQK